MSRRTVRTRPSALGLPGGTLEAQVELLLPQVQQQGADSSSGVFSRMSAGLDCLAMAHASPMRVTNLVLIGSLAAPSVSASRASSGADAVDLEHDAAGLDAHHPEFRRTLARAHAHFGRLLADRHVGEDADPDAAGTLHGAGDGAAGRFDLPRGDALGLQRLQAVGAEIQRHVALGIALDAALVGLAVFGALGLQHCRGFLSAAAPVRRRGGPAPAGRGRESRP